MTTHSSTPAWKISGTEKPGGLQRIGSQSKVTEHKVGVVGKEIPRGAILRNEPGAPKAFQVLSHVRGQRSHGQDPVQGPGLHICARGLQMLQMICTKGGLTSPFQRLGN